MTEKVIEKKEKEEVVDETPETEETDSTVETPQTKEKMLPQSQVNGLLKAERKQAEQVRLAQIAEKDEQISKYESLFKKTVDDLLKEAREDVVDALAGKSLVEQYEYLTNPKHNSAFKKSEFPQLPEKKAKGAPEVDNTSWWNLKPKI